jgi:hypothetical protein
MPVTSVADRPKTMKYAYYASGFREQRGSHTGIKTNQRLVLEKYQSSDCCVIYVEWDDDPKQYAKDLAGRWSRGDTLILTGYSWGCGNWIKKFLWALWKADPTIVADHVLLIDPVVRSAWPWMRWTAISSFGTINLPPNMDDMDGFRQEQNEPNASAITVGDVRFGRKHFPKLPYKHTQIDNCEPVAHVIMANAARFLSTQEQPSE